MARREEEACVDVVGEVRAILLLLTKLLALVRRLCVDSHRVHLRLVEAADAVGKDGAAGLSIVGACWACDRGGTFLTCLATFAVAEEEALTWGRV